MILQGMMIDSAWVNDVATRWVDGLPATGGPSPDIAAVSELVSEGPASYGRILDRMIRDGLPPAQTGFENPDDDYFIQSEVADAASKLFSIMHKVTVAQLARSNPAAARFEAEEFESSILFATDRNRVAGTANLTLIPARDLDYLATNVLERMLQGGLATAGEKGQRSEFEAYTLHHYRVVQSRLRVLLGSQRYEDPHGLGAELDQRFRAKLRGHDVSALRLREMIDSLQPFHFHWSDAAIIDLDGDIRSVHDKLESILR